MTVPFLDLRAAYVELKPEIDSAIARVLDSGYYILGPEVEAFETEYAAYCETAHCVGVGNGLEALILSLRALEIGPGHEVIVPSNTFIATWLAVSAVGATVVAAEPDPRTHTIDPDRLEALITPRTRAVIPVHLYGQPADLSPILAFARAHGLAVIEDAAQAQGARYEGRRIGGHGDIVCWSFYPGKNLGALGDAGAITTDRADLADRVRVLHNYGSRQKYHNEVEGVNSRLDPIQAAILRVKLGHLDAWTERRRAIAARYAEAFGASNLITPLVPNRVEPVWHLFVVRAPDRDGLQARLAEKGIGTLVHYPIPPHMQAAYSHLDIPADALPLAARLSREVLSLPIGPHLTSEMCDDVIRAVLASA